MPSEDGDLATPQIWLLPHDFDEQEFISAGSDPEAYNQRKMQSETSRIEIPPVRERETSTVPRSQQSKLLYSEVLARGMKNSTPTNRQSQPVFHPMHTKLHPNPTNPTSNAHQAIRPSLETSLPPQTPQRINAGFSVNYRGNTSLPRNLGPADTPANQNCSLFLTGLPPKVTVHALLAAIRNAGRVYAVHINPPEPSKGHFTCAAKVIFFERRAAERFHHRHREVGLRIPGHPSPARVLWNRVRCGEVDRPPYHSRVLMISGPVDVVDEGFLTDYFRTKFDFEVDEVLLGKPEMDADEAVVEYRFGSYRCQAEAAKMALTRELGDRVRVWFGEDPCDVHHSTKEGGGKVT